MDINSKKIIIFDLDGTLTASKSAMDEEMSDLLCGLLTKKKVAVIGGGKWNQFQDQFLTHLQCLEDLLSNLFLFPTSGTRFYRYKSGIWIEVYAEVLDIAEREKIKSAFDEALKKTNYQSPEKIYGEVIEDRGTQITFSALGQKAPIAEKEKWKIENESKRQEIAVVLRELLPEFAVITSAMTSIDVTRKGIDKGYGVRQIEKYLKIPISEMVFIGDGLYPGGNDYAAIETGVETIAVSSPEETKKLLNSWIV